MDNAKRLLLFGLAFVLMFAVWTLLVVTVDVKAVGVNHTDIGFSALNTWFHSVVGVNMTLYAVTDWAGLVPIGVCFGFGAVGLTELIKRRKFKLVDKDILFLGLYYIVVILCYFLFESIIINYRPVLINGVMESSYPSSTTLLVLCVMPTLGFQANRRLKNKGIKNIINAFVIIFSLFMVFGRLCSGVHWLTDIIGAVFLSTGLFCVYKSVVLFTA